MNLWHRHGLMVEIWNHGIDMDTRSTDNTNVIDLSPWYRIGTLESHSYNRAKGCLYVGLNLLLLLLLPDIERCSCLPYEYSFIHAILILPPFKNLLLKPSKKLSDVCYS